MTDRSTINYMRGTRKLASGYDRWLDSYPDDEPEDDTPDETDDAIINEYE